MSPERSFDYDLTTFAPGTGGLWWVQVRLIPSGRWMDVEGHMTRRSAISAARRRPIVRQKAYEAWKREQGYR